LTSFSFEDPALLAQAVEGAEALLWLTPPPARHGELPSLRRHDRERRPNVLTDPNGKEVAPGGDDIAAKAACWLLDRSWSGHHQVGIHGPKDLSPDEAAAIISSVLGKAVKCVEATPDQARGAMKAMGMPDFVVDIIIEQYAAFRDGRLESAKLRTPDTTTPKTLAEFTRTTLMPAIPAAS
jgi:hypothetical protein